MVLLDVSQNHDWEHDKGRKDCSIRGNYKTVAGGNDKKWKWQISDRWISKERGESCGIWERCKAFVFLKSLRPLFHTQNLFVFSSHDSLRDYNSILLGTYNCICGSLIVSKCFRLKFLLHSCYSLTVPRKRWKDVFWGATRFPSWLINCVSFSHRILVSNISYCAFRGELMITLRLLRKGSKLLWNQVYLS